MIEKEKSSLTPESPSKLFNDETHIADDTIYEEPSIAVERNKLTDLENLKRTLHLQPCNVHSIQSMLHIFR